MTENKVVEAEAVQEKKNPLREEMLEYKQYTGPYSLIEYAKDVLAMNKIGFTVKQATYMPLSTVRAIYEPTEAAISRALQGMALEEKIQFVMKDTGKERLLTIAKIEGITIPKSAKVPLKIRSIITEALSKRAVPTKAGESKEDDK